MLKDELEPRDVVLRPEITNVERISVGQEFLLFDPQQTQIHIKTYRGIEIPYLKKEITYSREFYIESELLAGIHFCAATFNSTPGRLDLIPFNPELGYEPSEEDLNCDTRKIKVLREKWNTEKQIDENIAPLELYIYSTGGTDDIGLKVETADILEEREKNRVSSLSNPNSERIAYHLPEEVISEIAKLRLQLKFPSDKKYEAVPFWRCPFVEFGSGKILDRGGLMFKRFYPVELGPLAPAEPASLTNIPLTLYGNSEVDHRYDGQPIHLPEDPIKLTQIRAKFVVII